MLIFIVVLLYNNTCNESDTFALLKREKTYNYCIK